MTSRSKVLPREVGGCGAAEPSVGREDETVVKTSPAVAVLVQRGMSYKTDTLGARVSICSLEFVGAASLV